MKSTSGDSTIINIPESRNKTVLKEKRHLLGATAAALGVAITMGFFVVAMGIVGAYLVLSLPFSIVKIVLHHAVPPRVLLLIFDTLALTLNTSCAATIVYLACNGNSDANWLAICQQFGDFCQQSSGAVVSAFVTVVILILLSASALRKV
ncbi:hypothetical protein CerSpe_268550 [Prunus speciosa]